MQVHLIRVRIITFFQRISYGILLGVMQLLLLFLLGINLLNGLTVIIVGLILYLVIPGLAGLRNARRSESVASGTITGFVTGLTGAIIVMLALVILAIIVSIVPPPPTTLTTRMYISASSVVALIIMMTLILSLAGIILALIGGVLGGFFGRRVQSGRYD